MKKKNGFSLGEMMVIMLIIAISAAVSAPMMTKRITTYDSDPWAYVDEKNSSIAYNMNNAIQTASIGAINPPENSRPRLFIKSDANTPHLALSTGGNAFRIIADTAKVLFTSNNNQVVNLNNALALGPNTSVVAGSTAIGSGTTISGARNVAIGINRILNNVQNTVSIGAAANVNNNNCVVIGEATITGDNAVAISKPAVNGDTMVAANAAANSLVIGSGARGSGLGSIAIGPMSRADFQDAIAIGSNVNSTFNGGNNSNSIAIGNNAQATAQGTTAIGGQAVVDGQTRSAQATAQNATAYGAGASATAQNAVAIGNVAGAFTSGSIAIGNDARATTNTSSSGDIAIGNGSRALNGAIAIGSNATAAVQGAMVIGHNTRLTNRSATVIGNDLGTVNPDKDNMVIIGDENTTVHIPGRLVVDSAVAAKSLYANDYLLVYGDDGGLFFAAEANKPNKDPANAFHTVEFVGQSAVIQGDSKKDTGLVSNPGATLWREFNEGFSDRRLKNVGEAFKGGLEEIKKLEVFNYTYKKDAEKTPHVGVIAQDLQKIFPDAVFKGEDGFLRIRMEDMFYAVVNAIKEIDIKIAQHDKQLEDLDEQSKKIAKKIAKIEKRVNKLENKKRKNNV